ncbi:unnamed protein product [Effrenium voratum]|uniref:Uncharacterized protein n=1 Tax=Effrenium voratum TaxID=2562239 RepID=A0AA36NDW2_9DINO|nr:unnamed protein product [Effrenium voratum]CAJ1450293.1 unnamed protein product [Effrenium voratum]
MRGTRRWRAPRALSLLWLVLLTAEATSLKSASKSVSSVVQLLKAMEKTMVQETEEDAKSQKKLLCRCETEKKEKGETIERSTAHMAELASSIDSWTATKTRLAISLQELEKQVGDGEAALAQAAAVRAEQQKKFASYASDTGNYLESLKAALRVLSKAKALPQLTRSPAMLLQTGEESDLERSLDDFLRQHFGQRPRERLRGPGAAASALSDSEQAVVETGLSAALAFMQSKGESEFYSPSNGELVGMLSQMMSSMKEDLATAQAAESAEARQFQALHAARLEETQEARSMRDIKNAEAAQAGEALVLAKAEKKQLIEVLRGSRQALASLEQTCAEGARNFEDRKSARWAEQEAVTDAIEVLENPEVSFLQLTSRSGHAEREAAPSAPAWAEVRWAVESMVSELQQQQRAERRKKDWCAQEFSENQRDTTQARDRRSFLKAKAAEMDTEMQSLAKDVAQSTQQVQRLERELQVAGLDRKEEQQAFRRTYWDQLMTIRALKQASAKLSEVYGEATGASESVQKSPMGSKVLGLLETLMEDSRSLLEKAAKSENDAEAGYGKFVKQSNDMLQTLHRDLILKSRAQGRAERLLAGNQGDLDAVLLDLKDLLEQQGNLQAQCDFLLKNFAASQSKRQEEIQALQESKAILS